jgi:hypothetical protein
VQLENVSVALNEGSGENPETFKEIIKAKHSPYARLERHLMTNYNKRIIPRIAPKNPVTVRMSMQLYQIVSVVSIEHFMLRDRKCIIHGAGTSGAKFILNEKGSIPLPDRNFYFSESKKFFKANPP